ncbi:MAG TPA: hypothetical protein ENK06_02295 [Gammaproteobacteria bacterium]|nr:hypothetical protein [Gammaproteobacteria bacterium]
MLSSLVFKRLPAVVLGGICSAIAFCSQNVYAAAIGQPSTIQMGFGSYLNLVTANDAQGHTRRKISPQLGSLFITDWFIDDTRYLTELYASKYSFAAETGTIGEQVDNKGVRFSVQLNAKHGKYFSPWYGLGVDLSHTQYTKRHKIDSDGFLIAQYEDTTKAGINLLLNVLETWSVSSNIEVGAKLEYSIPLTQTIHGFSAGLLMIFHPEF